MGWTLRESNHREGEIFHTRPDRLWGPINGYRISFSRVKRPGRDVNHPPPSSAEVKERVELYLYSSFENSQAVLGWNLPSNFLPYPYWFWVLSAPMSKKLVTLTNAHSRSRPGNLQFLQNPMSWNISFIIVLRLRNLTSEESRFHSRQGKKIPSLCPKPFRPAVRGQTSFLLMGSWSKMWCWRRVEKLVNPIMWKIEYYKESNRAGIC